MAEKAIKVRIASGRLHPVHRGVYAVGHRAIGRRGQMLAAVLACGPGAFLSHRAAAELHGLSGKQPVLIDVISPSQSGRKLDGICWHRSIDLRPPDVTVQEGIRTTGVSRTLVDLAGMLGGKSLRRLVEEAAVRRTLDVAEVDRILARGRRRGSPQLEAILRAWRSEDPPPTGQRSGLEGWLLSAVLEAGLPRPQCNVLLKVDGERFEIDLFWPQQRLAIETDGEETHATTLAFNRDRWRDQVLTAAGYHPARVTWRQMEDEPDGVLERIGRMLER